MAFKIFLSPPNMGGKELAYVKDAFETNWIAPYGPSLNAFEKEMCEYIHVDAGLALSSGTAAIHLALRWYGVNPGDTVFCSDLTFIGSCNPIAYMGAEPVFIDSEPDSWNMSPVALEKAFHWAKKQNKMPKAVIVVDLYGESADWDSLIPICREYGVPIIEDAAEAVGSQYKGRHCGSFGDIAALSFNGNKIITTSGGGMALSDSNLVAVEKMRFWATQSREPLMHYEHKEFGYNYRMSNICAAIGRGQLAFLPEKLMRRAKIKQRYEEGLAGLPVHIKREPRKCVSNNWLSMAVLDTRQITPAEIVTFLQNADIEARPCWKPMHMQPVFRDAASFPHEDGRFISEAVFASALCLPSGDRMTDAQQDMVIDECKACLRSLAPAAIAPV